MCTVVCLIAIGSFLAALAVCTPAAATELILGKYRMDAAALE